MLNAIGPLELLIIFSIILMVFGADKLPDLARGLGKGMREFRKAANMVRNEIMSEDLRVPNPIRDELNEIGDLMKDDGKPNPNQDKDRPGEGAPPADHNAKDK